MRHGHGVPTLLLCAQFSPENFWSGETKREHRLCPLQRVRSHKPCIPLFEGGKSQSSCRKKLKERVFQLKMPSKKTRLLLNKKAAVTENSPQTLQNDPSPSPKMDNAAASLCSSAVPVTNIGRVDSKIQQAKQFAIAQAQKDGCVGNFKSFNSHFGNYLVPVIPTEADLNV